MSKSSQPTMADRLDSYFFSLVVFIMCINIEWMHASCVFKTTPTVPNDDGSVEVFCVYKKIQMFPGSIIDDRKDCQTVYCRANVMAICGLRPGVIPELKEGCKTEIQGCKKIIVQDESSSVRCPVISENNGKPPASPPEPSNSNDRNPNHADYSKYFRRRKPNSNQGRTDQSHRNSNDNYSGGRGRHA